MAKSTNLFELLDEKGITQKQLAEAINVSQGTIGDWKSGKSKPGFDILIKIADFLDVPADYLLGRVEKESAAVSFLKIGKLMKSHGQRLVSFNNGDSSKLANEYQSICKFAKCSLPFLFGTEKEYTPVETDGKETFGASDGEILTLIYDILDRPSEDNTYMILKIQLSRIILHNLNADKEELKKRCKFVNEKVEFLYDTSRSFDKVWDCGLNFSDLMRIREEYGVSALFLLTGVKWK